jgi:hypothetical protein
MSMRHWLAGSIVMAVAPVLAGCPGDERPRPQTEHVQQVDTGQEVFVEPERTEASFDIRPVGEAGVTGEGRLVDMAGETHLSISAVLPGPQAVEGELHTGSCRQLGPPAGRLQPFSTPGGEGGVVTSATHLAVPVATLADGNHAVAIYTRPRGAEPVACGEIPRAAP